MFNLEEYVKGIPYLDMLIIIDDWENFSKNGYIGDCYLREYAKTIQDFYNNEISIVLAMEKFIFEIFKYLAYKYLNNNVIR